MTSLSLTQVQLASRDQSCRNPYHVEPLRPFRPWTSHIRTMHQEKIIDTGPPGVLVLTVARLPVICMNGTECFCVWQSTEAINPRIRGRSRPEPEACTGKMNSNAYRDQANHLAHICRALGERQLRLNNPPERAAPEETRIDTANLEGIYNKLLRSFPIYLQRFKVLFRRRSQGSKGGRQHFEQVLHRTASGSATAIHDETLVFSCSWQRIPVKCWSP